MFMEFNEKLRELRKQKGLTQEELAEAIYVSRTAISKWESGRGYPNIDSLKAIARVFSLSIVVIFGGGFAVSGNRLVDTGRGDDRIGGIDIGATKLSVAEVDEIQE